MATFETPKLEMNMKIEVDGEDAKELFIDFATRNGKYVKDQIARRIWAKHELPMYRGTIVDEVPFVLKLEQILFNFRAYKVAVVYQFLPQ